jgi:hypothetical protein
METLKEAHGYNATITLTNKGITIKPGHVGAVFGGGNLMSEKTIPYSSVVSLELQRGWFIFEGYLQINTQGSKDTEDTDNGDAVNANVIKFLPGGNKDFEEVKDIILGKLGQE